jgi:hypothetical protein
MRSSYTVKNPHRDPNISNERWVDESIDTPVETSEEQQQLLFEHLYRKCTCGSGDVWSECNGRDGDSTYCG